MKVINPTFNGMIVKILNDGISNDEEHLSARQCDASIGRDRPHCQVGAAAKQNFVSANSVKAEGQFGPVSIFAMCKIPSASGRTREAVITGHQSHKDSRRRRRQKALAPEGKESDERRKPVRTMGEGATRQARREKVENHFRFSCSVDGGEASGGSLVASRTKTTKRNREDDQEKEEEQRRGLLKVDRVQGTINSIFNTAIVFQGPIYIPDAAKVPGLLDEICLEGETAIGVQTERIMYLPVNDNDSARATDNAGDGPTDRLGSSYELATIAGIDGR
ncbi:hypothetical protein WN55_08300 [Dufourea novaeangliae]|uniref:Uncharacterized protein n=1 Tax=Dufourea novaeangliae TaxID=178035 RepID=A0A154P6H1_DUFNO|nr:hypothetical protein WN55_08300 [Dufourea novaeangliae]